MISTEEAYNFLSSFWHHHPIDAKSIVEHRRIGRSDGWLEAIQCGMAANSALNDSESEIRRCLEGCVCGELLVHLAIYLRDSGYSIYIEQDAKDEREKNMEEWVLVDLYLLVSEVKPIETKQPTKPKGKRPNLLDD